MNSIELDKNFKINYIGLYDFVKTRRLPVELSIWRI